MAGKVTVGQESHSQFIHRLALMSKNHGSFHVVTSVLWCACLGRCKFVVYTSGDHRAIRRRGILDDAADDGAVDVVHLPWSW